MLDTKTIIIDEDIFDARPIYEEFEKSTEYRHWYEGETGGLFSDAFVSFFSTYLRSKGIDTRYIECHTVGTYKGYYKFHFCSEKDALLFRLKIQSE